jgi:hypothetical protein
MDKDGHFWNFVAGSAAGILEYTVKVGVQNILEGKPLSQALNGWDPKQASISAVKGAVVYGLGLGPVGRAFVTGVADATGSAVQQYQASGEVDIGRAMAEGAVGSILSHGVGKIFGYPHPYVPGALPAGRFAQTALFGSHAQQEYFRAAFRGGIRGPLKANIKSIFFPPHAYASDINYNGAYNSSLYGGTQQSIGQGSWGGLASGGK